MSFHRYVVGIVFAEDLRTILLIRKMRPEWQAGMLNGPGGKVETGEEPIEAMVREFREESGLEVPAEKWKHVVMYRGPDCDIWFYTTATDDIFDARKTTDEPVERYHVDNLREIPVIPNLRWIIPLCLDRSVELPMEIQGL